MGVSPEGPAAGGAAAARRYERPLVVVLVLTGVAYAVFGGVIANRALAPAPFGGGWLVLLALAAVPFAAIALWLAWFDAAYGVARAAGTARYGPLMARLGWLVPVVMLFVPMRMVNDVWRAGGDTPAPRVVRWWWLLWFSASFFSGLDPFLRGRDERAELVDAVVPWLVALATPFAVATVRALTERVATVAPRA